MTPLRWLEALSLLLLPVALVAETLPYYRTRRRKEPK
jgi:hypothetical protein